MTEAEWLVCTEPERMLKFIRGKGSDRKLRLLACACCRRTWHLLTDLRSRKAVETAELYADGLATDEQRETAGAEAVEAGLDYHDRDEPDTPERLAASLLNEAAQSAVWGPTYYCPIRQEVLRYDGDLALSYISDAISVLRSGSRDEALPLADNDTIFRSGLVAIHSFSLDERIAQIELLHDIFDHLFYALRPDSFGGSAIVVGLARTAYESRELPSGQLNADRLAILADALEEAGCTDETILSHLREPGPHVRGCWVIDQILGKE